LLRLLHVRFSEVPADSGLQRLPPVRLRLLTAYAEVKSHHATIPNQPPPDAS